MRVDGFQEPEFDSTLFDRLVMKASTKELIKDLTKMYIRDSAGPHLREDKMYSKVTEVHKPQRRKKVDTTWSPDFIEGKGEGLTILLHGRPGVGKTYTAGKLILALTSWAFC
ncbi:hypothetical protein IMZ48_47690 [Candidatus Bathyarchaeota archaeon]|nr:hypothetical protein [Candidatus Bathyarchaeota archaeon]